MGMWRIKVPIIILLVTYCKTFIVRIAVILFFSLCNTGESLQTIFLIPLNSLN